MFLKILCQFVEVKANIFGTRTKGLMIAKTLSQITGSHFSNTAALSRPPTEVHGGHSLPRPAARDAGECKKYR